MSLRNRPPCGRKCKPFRRARTMPGRAATGVGAARTTSGSPVVGSLDRARPQSGWKVTGSGTTAAGSGSPAIGDRSWFDPLSSDASPARMGPIIRLVLAPLGGVLRSRDNPNPPNPFLANLVDRVSDAVQRGLDYCFIGQSIFLRQLHLRQIQDRHKTPGFGGLLTTHGNAEDREQI